jgi:quinol-cytochrome oxidoreductase complex cytochrome b subunit
MEIFPTKELKFKLLDSKEETIERLKRRTEFSEKMTSNFTDKSFRGILNGDEFKIISSEIGKGALCVMTGKIDNDNSYVNVEMNKAFRILFSIMFVMPIIALTIETVKKPNDILIFILVGIGQILMIRFFFIGIFFSRMSKQSLNRLRDVLDIEFKE